MYYVWEECVSSRGLKRHNSEISPGKSYTKRTKKNTYRHRWVYEYSEKMCRFV